MENIVYAIGESRMLYATDQCYLRKVLEMKLLKITKKIVTLLANFILLGLIEVLIFYFNKIFESFSFLFLIK
jgi:hypothetical protein